MKGNDVDKEGVCDGEGSKRFVFFECSLFRVVVAISPEEGGGNLLLRGYMTYPPRIHIIIIIMLSTTTATCLISHLQPFG